MKAKGFEFFFNVMRLAVMFSVYPSAISNNSKYF